MTGPTYVTIGVDIKDIPKVLHCYLLTLLILVKPGHIEQNDHHSFCVKVSDKDFSITINAYFNVKWRDPRLLVSKDYSKEGRQPEVMLLLNVFPQSFFCWPKI